MSRSRFGALRLRQCMQAAMVSFILLSRAAATLAS